MDDPIKKPKTEIKNLFIGHLNLRKILYKRICSRWRLGHIYEEERKLTNQPRHKEQIIKREKYESQCRKKLEIM